MPFKPELPHHRAAYDRVARSRWRALGVGMVVAAVIVFLVPVDYHLAILGPLFVIFVAVIGAVELKLVLIFRKDLLERRERLRSGRQ